ncbi:hypothetical protein GCM10008096_27340 [Zhihengliuella salsuginis]|uniref:Uncharacterized protein n=1 Tax=Zhihengliuella salsuginis TaxID=578222 RepID=A0ABQ3GL08_9MICC|nr:hypothetical protein GCM10008096_27340 [Zhihengliuella salsuginis]
MGDDLGVRIDERYTQMPRHRTPERGLARGHRPDQTEDVRTAGRQTGVAAARWNTGRISHVFEASTRA